MARTVDLRSDTVTRPGPAMRAAIASAEVGDDVLREDPTVNGLEEYAASLMGKEAALFVPTGTMANLIAFLVQGRPGDAVILSDQSHPVNYEGGNLARFAGLLARPLPGEQGKFSPAQLQAALVLKDDPHFANTRVAAIENTTNRGGGAYYTPEEVSELGAICRANGLRLHCDGARIFNASVAQGVDPATLAAPCDTLSFCCSKGLGAPAGSLLVGDATTIHEARRVRKQLGGGMRQAGILAAACRYALDHLIPDLAEDHRRANEFRLRLEAEGLRFALPSPTNILMLRAPDAERVQDSLAERGVRVFAVGPDTLRIVFHRDISDADLDHAVETFLAVCR